MRDASTLAYDRRHRDRTLVEIYDLQTERENLQRLLLSTSDEEPEYERISLALDACSDAIGQRENDLFELEYEIGLSGGAWR